MPDLISPSLDDQIACVEREIKLRERTYPRWIFNKRMSERTASYELDTMRAVLDTLRGLKT
jgi:hypothetical protein